MVLNFDQSQTYLRSAVWNPLGAAVFAEADCVIGSSTALCLAAAAAAAAACDRAGSLDSNGIIIRPFQVFSVFPRLCPTVELNIIHGLRFLQSLLALLFFCVCLPSRAVCHLSEVPPLPTSPLYTGFWPRAGHFTEADFPRLPKGYFTRIPIRSLAITNVPNHLQENLFTLCGNGFIWFALKKLSM